MVRSFFRCIRISFPHYLARGAKIVPDNILIEYELEEAQVEMQLEIKIEETLHRLVQSQLVV